ncbi:phosphoribosylformylglycinamidine cyclo-ligase [Candidatus Roizmanbacteria bacterium]|nr:phosphoribosylformylglycinamidine cyclo-ligase [Candidatus Roizmanbacteria bacterium]
MTRKDDDFMTYQGSGVNYEAMDPFKRHAMRRAFETRGNMHRFGFAEVTLSRGESAYVFDQGNFYGVFQPEGLGTENLVADAMDEGMTDESYYYQIGKSSVGVISNDILTVGAQPVVLSPHWAVGHNDWFNHRHAEALVDGWADGCQEIGAVYGSGETSTLVDLVAKGSIEISGASYGIIFPKKRLALGHNLKPGDHIIGAASSGVHDNGFTLIRKLSGKLPEGYQTKMPSGRMFGDAVLTATRLYAPLQDGLFSEGINIHYMANVTGHGLRKLMRARQPFTYRIHTLPEPQEEFGFIQEHGPVSTDEMYGNYNMGTGYAFYVPEEQAEEAITISRQLGFETMDMGIVEEGEKQVVLEPIGITFREESLQLR